MALTNLDQCRINIQDAVEELNNILGSDQLTSSGGHKTLLAYVNEWKTSNNILGTNDTYTKAEIEAKLTEVSNRLTALGV